MYCTVLNLSLRTSICYSNEILSQSIWCWRIFQRIILQYKLFHKQIIIYKHYSGASKEKKAFSCPMASVWCVWYAAVLNYLRPYLWPSTTRTNAIYPVITSTSSVLKNWKTDKSRLCAPDIPDILAEISQCKQICINQLCFFLSTLEKWIMGNSGNWWH